MQETFNRALRYYRPYSGMCLALLRLSVLEGQDSSISQAGKQVEKFMQSLRRRQAYLPHALALNFPRLTSEEVEAACSLIYQNWENRYKTVKALRKLNRSRHPLWRLLKLK